MREPANSVNFEQTRRSTAMSTPDRLPYVEAELNYIVPMQFSSAST